MLSKLRAGKCLQFNEVKPSISKDAGILHVSNEIVREMAVTGCFLNCVCASCG